MKHECENCKLQFDAEDPLNCPRCSSRKIRKVFDKKKFGDRGGGFGRQQGHSTGTGTAPSQAPASATSSTGDASGQGQASTSPTTATSAGDKPKVFFSSRDVSMREGKEGWKEFHSSEIRACTDCGGAEFTYNWKHKEKTCVKCGSVYNLQRRSR